MADLHNVHITKLWTLQNVHLYVIHKTKLLTIHNRHMLVPTACTLKIFENF